jgi:hypothetical protein
MGSTAQQHGAGGGAPTWPGEWHSVAQRVTAQGPAYAGPGPSLQGSTRSCACLPALPAFLPALSAGWRVLQGTYLPAAVADDLQGMQQHRELLAAMNQLRALYSAAQDCRSRMTARTAARLPRQAHMALLNHSMMALLLAAALLPAGHTRLALVPCIPACCCCCCCCRCRRRRRCCCCAFWWRN